MKFKETNIADLFVITLEPKFDDRGFFFRNYCSNELKQIGVKKEIVQINQSLSVKKGTIRGLHYQIPPYSETKIVQCIQGHILDIAVDIRKDSPTFLKHFKIELKSNDFNMVCIPNGFAHGIMVLEDNSIIQYFNTEFYTPNSEGGLNISDPSLNIDLPISISSISERDKNHHFIDNTFTGI